MALIDVVIPPREDYEPAGLDIGFTPANPITMDVVIKKSMVPQLGGYILGYVVFDEPASGKVTITVSFAYYDSVNNIIAKEAVYVSKTIEFTENDLIQAEMMVKTSTGYVSKTIYALPFTMTNLPDETSALFEVINVIYAVNRIKISVVFSNGVTTETLDKWFEVLITSSIYNAAQKTLVDANNQVMANARIAVIAWGEDTRYMSIKWVGSDNNGVFRVPYDVFYVRTLSGVDPQIRIFAATETQTFPFVTVVYGDTKLDYTTLLSTTTIKLSTETKSDIVKVVVERNVKFKMYDITGTTTSEVITSLKDFSNTLNGYLSSVGVRVDIQPTGDKVGRLITVDLSTAAQITDTSAGDVGIIYNKFINGEISDQEAIIGMSSAIAVALTSYLKYVADFNDPYAFINEIWCESKYEVVDTTHTVSFYANFTFIMVAMSPLVQLALIALIALVIATAAIVWAISYAIVQWRWSDVAMAKVDVLKQKINAMIELKQNTSSAQVSPQVADALAQINDRYLANLQTTPMDMVWAFFTKIMLPIMIIGMIFLGIYLAIKFFAREKD